MEPLATVEDVQRLGAPVDDTGKVLELIESVSSAVREAAGSSITVSDVTVVREGTWDQHLLLPTLVVREVVDVKLDGQSISDWRLRGNRLYRSRGWGNSDVDVEITYTQGLDVPPPDISTLVASFVAAGLHGASEGVGTTRGLSSVGVDDARETYTRGEDEIVDPTELPERVKNSLAARFSGGASVSRSL